MLAVGKWFPSPFSVIGLFSKEREQMGIHPGHKIFTAFKWAKASLRLSFSAYWIKALCGITFFPCVLGQNVGLNVWLCHVVLKQLTFSVLSLSIAHWYFYYILQGLFHNLTITLFMWRGTGLVRIFKINWLEDAHSLQLIRQGLF